MNRLLVKNTNDIKKTEKPGFEGYYFKLSGVNYLHKN